MVARLMERLTARRTFNAQMETYRECRRASADCRADQAGNRGDAIVRTVRV
jgi:hypothetical protein